MNREKLEKAVFTAFLLAAEQLGPKIKGMSCFVKNWRNVAPVADTTKQAA